MYDLKCLEKEDKDNEYKFQQNLIEHVDNNINQDLEENNDEEQEKVTVEMKLNFIKKVEILSRQEHLQLLRMLKAFNIQITENFNGSFINLSHISDSHFLALNKYVSISYQNNIENEERIKELEKLSDEVNNKSEQLTKEEELEINDEQQNKIPKKLNEQEIIKTNNLNDIKNNKNLNSLEKAIMRQNLANNNLEMNENKNFHLESYKNSQKYTGIRAKLLKTCKEINKSDSFSTNTNDDKKKKKKDIPNQKEGITI